MERVAIRDVEPDGVGGAARRALTGPLGTTDLACNRYRVPPGAGLPGGLHAHFDQEEVFVVLAGEATFEWYVPSDGPAGGGTDAAESGTVTVGAGEAVRFAPGEFQSGRNRTGTGSGGAADLVVLAFGAPRDGEDVHVPLPCPTCDYPKLCLDTGDDRLTLACSDCGAEHVPAPCPDCGADRDRLETTLDDGGRPVVACRDCAAEFDRPPVESNAGAE